MKCPTCQVTNVPEASYCLSCGGPLFAARPTALTNDPSPRPSAPPSPPYSATEESLKCPRCGSIHIHAEKRGWSWTTGILFSGRIMMTCLRCGQKFKPGHAVTSGGGTPRGGGQVQTAGNLIFGAIALVILLVAFVQNATSNTKPGSRISQVSDTTPIVPAPPLNLSTIALRKREVVETIVGKPLSYVRRTGSGEIGDTAMYKWGKLFYASDHLVAVDRFGPPRSFGAALAEFGLPEDSQPHIRGSDGTMVWEGHLHESGIKCCGGIVVHSAFMPADFRELNVWILDADEPAKWTDEECLMWLRFSGSPIPDKAMQRGNSLYWPIHHDNTPQACSSHR